MTTKKTDYPLEALLKLQRQERDEAEIRWIEARQRLDRAEQTLEAARQHLRELKVELSSLMDETDKARSRSFLVRDALDRREDERDVKRRIKAAEARAERAERSAGEIARETEALRESYLELTGQIEALERHREAWLEEAQKARARRAREEVEDQIIHRHITGGQE